MAIYTYFGNGNGFGASYGQGAAAFPHPLPAIVTTVAVGRQGESEGGESVGGCVFRHAGLGRPAGYAVQPCWAWTTNRLGVTWSFSAIVGDLLPGAGSRCKDCAPQVFGASVAGVVRSFDLEYCRGGAGASVESLEEKRTAEHACRRRCQDSIGRTAQHACRRHQLLLQNAELCKGPSRVGQVLGVEARGMRSLLRCAIALRGALAYKDACSMNRFTTVFDHTSKIVCL